MHEENGIKITTYDMLLRGWQESMELTKYFEVNSKRIDDDDTKQLFKEFAEDEGMHASKLKEMLHEYTDKN